MAGHVPENEIRHGDAHQIAAMRGDVPEIGFGDIGIAMPPQQGLELGRFHGPVQPDLVLLAAGREQPRLHPLLQHQPVAEAHPVDPLVNTQRHTLPR